MLRVVLLAACLPNVLAFKQRLFDKKADDSTGPTSRSLMLYDAAEERRLRRRRLVRHHDD